jgi:hypothetical protein
MRTTGTALGAERVRALTSVAPVVAETFLLIGWLSSGSPVVVARRG